jgi:predicted MFS family arabinose efflux permease
VRAYRRRMTSDTTPAPAPASVSTQAGRGFGRLLGAAVASRFGDALRGAAVPLLAVGLTGSPFLVSLVAVFQFLPWLLFGLLGGAIADRVDQRRAMWAVDGLRAALMAGFAVVVWAGEARIWMLLVLSFALTTLQTVFDNAATALLPAVVPAGGLARANGRLMTGQEIAYRFVGGPLVPLALGVSLALPYAADAASFLAAAVLIATLRVSVPERAVVRGRTLRHDIAEGVRAMWREQTLRALCVSAALANTGIGMLIGVLVVHITGWLGAGRTGYTVVLTSYGVGMVAAGALAHRIAGALGQVRALLAAGEVEVVALVAFGAVRSLAVAACALAVFGFASMVCMATEVTMIQQLSPEGMVARTSAAFRTLSVAGTPLGALLAGALAQTFALNTPVLAASALMAAGLAALYPLRH